jgi:putative hydrolase of the HAD superfamily
MTNPEVPMPHAAFAHVTTWVFDLDNTLYPVQMGLFPQIEVKMTAWVMRNLGLDHAAANALRRAYWHAHGTTLSGLMAEHDIDAGAYLADVHDVDFSVLQPAPDLAARLAALPGRRIIHTNADVPYAMKVLTARGLDGLFDAVYGIETAGFLPKPQAPAFAAIRALDGFDPATAAMFEDDPKNLIVPADLGMTTVLVGPTPLTAPHIHHHTDDLTGFLARLI